MERYLPEGYGERLNGDILEGDCIKCDSAGNLYVSYMGKVGIIPRDETAIGIKEHTVSDIAIITRVNKRVCFKAIEDNGNTVLSRVAAQRECLAHLYGRRAGDVIPAVVTHIEPFGVFADIGCGNISMIPLESISVSRIKHPSTRFYEGQKIYAVIKEIHNDTGRIDLSHKELLGSWTENARSFEVGQTVRGIIRSVEKYGSFIELTPNLAGLCEQTVGKVGQSAAVYIKSINERRMKIKLNIISLGDNEISPTPLKYFITSGHIDRFRYSPADCEKEIITEFA